jgi:hypothetical protein
MNSLNRKKWIAALDECDAHIVRIQHALDHLADKLPLIPKAACFWILEEEHRRPACELWRAVWVR